MVLNDIWLINYLKPFKDLLKDREVQISTLFLGGHSLDFHEKQFIELLDKEERIRLFKTDLGFLNITNENRDLITNSEASSIYYAELNNYPIITQHEVISRICKKRNVAVYRPSEALKIMNVANDKIQFIQNIINSSME